MIDKSFQIIRTNPTLTTNVSVVVNTDYNLYLESFKVNRQLSDERFKHFSMNKNTYLEDQLPIFYKGLPSNLAFKVKYEDDSDKMYNTYDCQFDDIYYAGAKNIQDQWYEEEFEYLAPLYIRPNNLPSNFIILRVDDSAVYDSNSYEIVNLTKNNFRSEIVDKWKCVTTFDLTYQSPLGYWMYRNFTENDRFPESPFEFDAKKYNFSRWYGIDYDYGTYTEKDFFLDDKLYYEQPHFQLEQFITEGYQLNNLIFPSIVNFKFLYDDTPASPFGLNKYSVNRYYGFYVEQMDEVCNLTSYQPPTLIDGLDIVNNIFVVSGTTGSTMPFINTWDNNNEYYIYALEDLYRVVKKSDDNVDTYKIISDYDLSITDIHSDNIVDIVFQNTGTSYINVVNGRTGEFTCDTYIDDDGYFKGLYGDLYLVDIDNKFHVLKVEQNIIEKSDIAYSYTSITESIPPFNVVYFNDDKIYIGADDGLFIYDIDLVLLNSYTTSNSSLPNSGVQSLFLDNNVLYVGTYEGMWIKDFDSGVEDTITNLNSGIEDAEQIKSIFVTGSTIFACARSGGTLTVSWSVKLSNKYDVTFYNTNVTGDVFNCKIEVQNNNLYSVISNGLDAGIFTVYYDLEPIASVEYNSANTSMEGIPLTFDLKDDGTIFLGTTEGLFIKKEYYEKNITQTTSYDITGSTSHVFYDNNNNVIFKWFENSASTGLMKYDTLTDTLTDYLLSPSIDYDNIYSGGVFYNENIVALTDSNTSLTYVNIYNLPIDQNDEIELKYYIDTDYAIKSNSSKLEYWIKSNDSEYSVVKDIRVNKKLRKPLMYPVYRVKFSDIKDWDFDRVDTHYADFDYEKTEYVDTDEHKLYTTEFRDNSTPKQFKVMPEGVPGQNKIMNVSSEYISTDELYQITETKDINPMWIKNETVCKWGFMNSISHSDYSYKLNNNNKVGSQFNKTTNIYKDTPSVTDKNMDYMYRVGGLHDNGTNEKYVQQSTNIETNLMNDDSQKFNLSLYVGSTFDYFDYFFKNKMYYEYESQLYIKSTTKYSIFKTTNNYNAASTLFKGLRIDLDSVANLFRDSNYKIYNIISGKKKYDEYKCSIIFNPCYQYIETVYNSDGDSGRTIADYVDVSGYSFYQTRYMDTVNWHYENLGIRGFITGQTMTLTSFTDLAYVNNGPLKLKRSYDASFIDYKDYYIKTTGFTFAGLTLPLYDFYDIDTTGDYSHFYSTGSSYYIDSTRLTAQIYQFSGDTGCTIYVSLDNWEEDDMTSNFSDFVVCGATYELYEVVNELDFESSAIINENYIDTSDTGIDIFLNDKYKNLLIVVNTKLTMFKDLYDLNNIKIFGENYGYYYAKALDGTPYNNTGISYNTVTLTASNVISALNDLNNTYGFDRNVYYHYIDENGNYAYMNMVPSATTNGTMEELESWGKDFPPYMVSISRPDLLTIKKQSFNHSALKGPRTNIYDKYKPVDASASVNYDINEPISRKITINEKDISKKVQQHGETQIYNKEIYRYSGPYEPIFKNIELFDGTDYSSHNGIFCQKSFASDVEITTNGLTGGTSGYTTVINWVDEENILDKSDNISAKIDFLIPDISAGLVVTLTGYSDTLRLSNFNFDIPNEAIISEINVIIKKKGDFIYYKLISIEKNLFFKDYLVDILINNTSSDNLSKTTIYNPYWIIDKYTISGIDISSAVTSSNIEINIDFSVYCDFDVVFLATPISSPTYNAYFDNVEVQVCYTMPRVTEGEYYFNALERNYKFNENLEDFGKVSEIIYSKINPVENVLKIRNTEEDRSIYPMVDEFGYSYVERFIFKSTWDKEYYIFTDKEVLDTSKDDTKKNLT